MRESWPSRASRPSHVTPSASMSGAGARTAVPTSPGSSWPPASSRGRTLLAVCLREVAVALDYLVSRDDVDLTRLGFRGHSYGGTWRPLSRWLPGAVVRTRWLLAACEANTLPDETRVQCLACWWSVASVRGPFRAATSLRAHGQTLRPVISSNVMQQVADPERRVRCRPRPRPAHAGRPAPARPGTTAACRARHVYDVS